MLVFCDHVLPFFCLCFFHSLVRPICPQRCFYRYVTACIRVITDVIQFCHLVPAIIYIDKWGRRPMLIIGTLLMGFWLCLVGGLQARFGAWGQVGTDSELCG